MSAFLGPKRTYALVMVEWFNQYTQPPTGRPRTLLVACIPWPEFDGDYMDLPPCRRCPSWRNCGYTVKWQFGGSIDGRRTFSAEVKANIRIRNLRRRIEKRAPLFFNQLMKQEVAKKPEYYDPEGIRKEKSAAEIDAEFEAERDEYWRQQFLGQEA